MLRPSSWPSPWMTLYVCLLGRWSFGTMVQLVWLMCMLIGRLLTQDGLLLQVGPFPTGRVWPPSILCYGALGLGSRLVGTWQQVRSLLSGADMMTVGLFRLLGLLKWLMALRRSLRLPGPLPLLVRGRLTLMTT